MKELFNKDAWFIICLSLLFLLISANTPHMGAAENQTAAIEWNAELKECMFNDVVADFQNLRSLLNDTTVNNGYQIPIHAVSIQEGINYLSQGFSPGLAESIAGYYLQENEQSGQIWVVPTESIPFITTQDRLNAEILPMDNEQGVINCHFVNCYLPGDKYLYSINVSKDKNRWIIQSVNLYCLDPGNFTFSPDGVTPPST